ncbi:hypothetical protein D3C81_1507610 [compost metagenome]
MPGRQLLVRDAVDEQVDLAAGRAAVLLGQPSPGQAFLVVLARLEGRGAGREGAADQLVAGFVEHLHVGVLAMLVLHQEILGGHRSLLLEARGPFGGDVAHAGMMGEDPAILVQGLAEQQRQAGHQGDGQPEGGEDAPEQ